MDRQTEGLVHISCLQLFDAFHEPSGGVSRETCKLPLLTKPFPMDQDGGRGG
jgi:hypothetical protein